MAKVSPASYAAKRRLLWYGPPKSGKTISLAHVPKGSKMHVVDADRQLGEMVNEWKRIHGSWKNLEIEAIDDMRDDTDPEAEKIFRQIRETLWSPPKGFDFYAVDSYTKVSMLLTHAIVGKGERNYNQSNNAELSGWVNDLWHQFVNRVELDNDNAWSITIMHEAWHDVEDGTKDPKDWRDKKQTLSPHCATSARISIPANCDFVFHVEKSRAVVSGKSKAVSVFRTQGTPLIMASAVGYSKILKATEPADVGELLKKLKLTNNSKRKKG